MIRINSEIQLGSSIISYSEKAVKEEPMLFNCDFRNAYDLGGPITKSFLAALHYTWNNTMGDIIIDSRVHMLMPGWWPCIPGWHHDDVPRERSDGQPEYFTPSYHSEHAMLLVNGDICPTEFALGSMDIDVPELGKTIYKEWHPIVDGLVKINALTSVKAPSNQLIFFNDRTWHQGTQATGNGWRFFIRATRGSNRIPTNEVRKQVQVYMSNPNDGW